MTTVRFGACNLCEAICGLRFELDGEKVVSITGDKADPLSRGHICPKAIALGDLHTDPDRLRKPLRRTATGWTEIDWDAAYDLVADRLAAVRTEHGANAVGVYLGNPSVHSLGAMTHGLAFFGMLRTRSRFSATSADQLPHQLAAHQMYGHQVLLPIPDLDRTDYFLVFGANPLVSNGSIMTVPDVGNRLKALRERDGKLVVFDPRRTETAARADEHVFVRPGTDAAVLLAMVRVILTEGLGKIASYVDGLDAVREAVSPFTLQFAAQVSGVPEAAIDRIAREFAAAPSAVCYGRVGVSTQRFGLAAQWAVQLMNIVTGNLDAPGGSMIPKPAVDVLKFISPGHFDAWRSRVRGLPEFGGELPVAALAEEIDTPGEGRIRALVTSAGNPVLSTPDGTRLDKALAGLDFMVSIDFYLNETTRHADVILPPTGPLERDHYDLVFHAFAVRNTARFNPALLPKPEGTKHDWEIFRDLGRRYVKRIPLRGMRKITALRLRIPPARLVDLLLRLGPYRLSLRKLRKAEHGVDLGPLGSRMPGVLPRGRVQAAPEVLRAAAAEAARELTAPAADELLLIGRRHLRSNNSWLHNAPRLVKGKPRHHLLMHPKDLAARGIVDGTTVLVRSAIGEVRVAVTATEDLMPGVVSLPHGFGHGRDGVRLSVASGVEGVSSNDLTDPGVVDASGNAVLNGVPVTVQAG
jgi:anaerobic selenocysteine-containing dehydrogenase